jgi:hypothetical protein
MEINLSSCVNHWGFRVVYGFLLHAFNFYLMSVWDAWFLLSVPVAIGITGWMAFGFEEIPNKKDEDFTDMANKPDETKVSEAFLDVAMKTRHVDGEMEFDKDAKVSLSYDEGADESYIIQGAYVQAWIWIPVDQLPGAALPKENRTK